MKKQAIIEFLKEYNQEEVEQFASYCVRLSMQKDKKGILKNPWILKKEEKQLADLFKRVANDGLVFDGNHVSLQSTGISYDYVAYKNKMLLAYPESKVDVALVYKDDNFQIAKETGSVIYTHSIGDPFNQKEENIVGAYCIIKNKRGEFATLLNKEEINKHRKVAKTDYIWRDWFKEMALKTVIKKACKQHFADVYESIEQNDNENYDLDNPIDIDLEWKQEIEAIETMGELKKYYLANKGKGKEFDKLINLKKKSLQYENTQN